MFRRGAVEGNRGELGIGGKAPAGFPIGGKLAAEKLRFGVRDAGLRGRAPDAAAAQVETAAAFATKDGVVFEACAPRDRSERDRDEQKVPHGRAC